MAALLLSVAHEVKMTSLACAPINSAACSRAVSIIDFSLAQILRSAQDDIGWTDSPTPW